MGTIHSAREAAIHALARELGIDFQRAERWCDAWERFANRHGVPRSQYFWDSARGWIDAQRAMGMVVGRAERSRNRGLAR